MTAYLRKKKGKFIAQVLNPGATDGIEEVGPGDLLFGTIPFAALKEGWWLRNGTFLGLTPDIFFDLNGEPLI